MENIPGLLYQPNFITPDEERILLDFIDGGTWNTELKRRTQHYGYRYSYTNRAVDSEDSLGDMPIVFGPVCERMVAAGFFSQAPQQVIVNEYLPGQSIANHVDSPVFGPVVASLSLESGISMNFESIHSDISKSMYLEPRSLLVLTGESRTEWKHGIPARKRDLVNGKQVPRTRRVSVTFRTLS